MRRRTDEFTPSPHPNAFSPELFESLHHRDPEPAAPEGHLPGPWRATRLHGDGPPLWAVYGLGERGPHLKLDDPEHADLAYLAAAALALAERPPRFRFQKGADGRLHLMHDGACVATVGSPALEHTSLATDLTRLADLRANPMALAQLLAATPETVLRRAGVIVLDELRKGR
jgi:hypothetical protein